MTIRVKVRIDDPTEALCVRVSAALTAEEGPGAGEVAFVAIPRIRAYPDTQGCAPLGIAAGFEGEVAPGLDVFVRLVGKPGRGELCDNDTTTWLWTHAATVRAGLAKIRAAVDAAVELNTTVALGSSAADGRRAVLIAVNSQYQRAAKVPHLSELHLAEGLAGRVTAAIAHARFARSPEGREAFARVGRAQQVVVLIAGPPGSGKSSVALQIAAAVSSELVLITATATFSLPPRAVAVVECVEKLEHGPGSAMAMQQVLANNHTTAANRDAATESLYILRVLDEAAAACTGSLFILTSSHPELLGQALLRRTDHVIVLDWASDTQTAALYASRYPGEQQAAPAFAAALRAGLGTTPVALGAVASFLTADRSAERTVAEAADLAIETRRRAQLSAEGSGGWWAHDAPTARQAPRFPEGFLA